MAVDKARREEHNAAPFYTPLSSRSYRMNFLFRRVTGIIANLVARCTCPRPIERSEHELRALAREVKRLRLYDYPSCPGSIRVRHMLRYLNLDIPYCDIRKRQIHRDSLLSELGRIHAPCLRIEEKGEVTWLDEPEQIVHYLRQRFDPAFTEERRAA